MIDTIKSFTKIHIAYVYSDLRLFNVCLIIAFNMKIQSLVLLLFRNPNCDSGKYDLSSAHSVNLALMIEIKIFPMLHDNVMPR